MLEVFPHVLRIRDGDEEVWCFGQFPSEECVTTDLNFPRALPAAAAELTADATPSFGGRLSCPSNVPSLEEHSAAFACCCRVPFPLFMSSVFIVSSIYVISVHFVNCSIGYHRTTSAFSSSSRKKCDELVFSLIHWHVDILLLVSRQVDGNGFAER